MILGIHASVARGHLRALEEAKSHDCAALQILPYRRHVAPTPEDLAAFRAARPASGVRILLIHSRFVPSLASSDPAFKISACAFTHLSPPLTVATKPTSSP